MQKLRIVVVLAVLAGLVVAHQFGLFGQFAEPAALKQALLSLGPWGHLAFVGAYTALQPFGVPGTVFVFGAALVWAWPVAFALSMVGTMAASVVGFSFARFIARDWVSRVASPRFHRYDEALARNGFATVFVLRFVFWMPQVLHAFFGLSKVPFWTHFWASAAGYALPLFLVSYFGESLFDGLRTAWNTLVA